MARALSWWVAVCVVLCCAGARARTPASADKDKDLALSRAASAVDGLFDFSWRSVLNKTDHTRHGFFFACGQIGGQGASDDPPPWYECVCETTSYPGCTNCYRWWDAVIMESLASLGIYNNTRAHQEMVEMVYVRSPYNATWTAHCSYIDDFAWFTLAYLRVYEWLGDEKWLEVAENLYEWTWKYGVDSKCGGVGWNMCNKYKNSVTMLELLEASARLSVLKPSSPVYLRRAKELWAWFFSFPGGLFDDKNLVSSGATGEDYASAPCCNATHSAKMADGTVLPKCHNEKGLGYTYNQGLFLSSCAFLYAATKDESYVKHGEKVLFAVAANMTSPGGVIVEQPPPTNWFYGTCMCGEDPGGDWYSFKGIFMVRLAYFLEHTKDVLSDSAIKTLQGIVSNSSNAAWSNSRAVPPFSQSDYCNHVSNTSKSTSPKFHWEWHTKADTPTPSPSPDPAAYFRKTDLRCVSYQGTELNHTTANSEAECKELCTNDTKCHQYSYCSQSYCASSYGYNCWTWPYNRSDHDCSQYDADFVTGIKRPSNNGTCSGHCASSSSVPLANGGVCYCDNQCEANLDCCLDYAEECVKDTAHWSCNAKCSSQTANAISGGGYCWCDESCYGYDRATTAATTSPTRHPLLGSDTLCCPDFDSQCSGTSTPLCMDARSQGSALGLFVSHFFVALSTGKSSLVPPQALPV